MSFRSNQLFKHVQVSIAPLLHPRPLDSCDGMAAWNLVTFVSHFFFLFIECSTDWLEQVLCKIWFISQSQESIFNQVGEIKVFSSFQWNVFSGSKATYSCGPYGYFRSTNGEIYYRYISSLKKIKKTPFIASMEAECMWNKTWAPATLDPCLSTSCQVLEVENLSLFSFQLITSRSLLKRAD